MNNDDLEYLNARPDGRTVIRTERLSIRELVRKNAVAVLDILSRYSGQELDLTQDIPVSEILSCPFPAERLGAVIAGDITDQYRFFGYGLWGVFLKSDLIGLAMLKNGPASGIAEIGYVILPEYAHRGFMKEAMLAVLEYARDQGFVSVVIRFSPGNKASADFFIALCRAYYSKQKKNFTHLQITSLSDHFQTTDVDSLSFTL